MASLATRLPDDLLASILSRLTPRTVALFFQADAARDAGEGLWLVLAAKLRLPSPSSMRTSSRSRTDPRRALLRNLKLRHERMLQQLDDVSAFEPACFCHPSLNLTVQRSTC